MHLRVKKKKQTTKHWNCESAMFYSRGCLARDQEEDFGHLGFTMVNNQIYL